MKFTDIKTPLDIVKSKLNEITSQSSGRVLFILQQYQQDENVIESIENSGITYKISVRNYKNTKFNLFILSLEYSLKLYPVTVKMIDDILVDYNKYNITDRSPFNWREVQLGSEEDFEVFLEDLLNDKDFQEILNSIYNL